MRVLICPDKFKGSMSGKEVGEALGEVLQAAGCECKVLPIADGGEGTVESIVDGMNGRTERCQVRGPLGELVEAKIGRIQFEGEEIAVMEMSQSSGMSLLSKEELNPLLTSSYGTGEMLDWARGQQLDKIIIGIGGSATNEGGLGMAIALGSKFFDRSGKEIFPGNGGQLGEVDRIVCRKFEIPVLIASDVRNPLLGENGATYVYGPQKGGNAEMLEKLENGMAHFAKKVESSLGGKWSHREGAGAAGGLGFGLMAFCGGEIRSGFQIVRELLKIDEALDWADVVITGEGNFDDQSVQGKGPGEIIKLANASHKPVYVIAGRNQCSDQAMMAAIEKIITLQDIEPDLDICMKEGRRLLKEAGRRLIADFR